jgi:ABC-type lipoprotein export system ATPase subunit
MGTKNQKPTMDDLVKQLLELNDNNLEAVIALVRASSPGSTRKKVASTRAYGDVVVNIQDVVKSYKIGRQTVKALRGVSLQIRAGEYVALTGPSGSGKSTLLQLIGALDKPSEGTITIDGMNVAKMSDRKLSSLRNKTVGFVFQFFYLQPFLNLQTNLEVPAMFARTPKNQRASKVQELAEKVGLADRLKHLPKELSGGQMQRAAIARALLNNPKIILADEPTGNLDRQNALAIMDLFEAIRDTYGTTIIIVTHDKELAARSDREIRLLDGEIQL